MAIMHANDESFAKEVKQGVVLVDFYANWCGPCIMLGPVLEQLDKEMAGKVKIVKVNVDDSKKTAAEHNVMGIPALFIYKGGKVVSSDTGAHPLPALKKWLEQVL